MQIPKNVVIVDPPVVQDALAILRDEKTDPARFRYEAERISLLLAAEAICNVPTIRITINTPMGIATGQKIKPDSVIVVPVLRAGLGMLDAVLKLVPKARVGHIGLQRDENTAVASQYYAKLPPGDLSACVALLIDPMLATGGSAVAAVDLLKQMGVHDIRMICIVAAPEGVALMGQRHHDVKIWTPVIDERLNDRKFIVPGLGDFGDRLYGTEG